MQTAIQDRPLASPFVGTLPLQSNDYAKSFSDGAFEELRERVPLLRRKLKSGQYLYRNGQPFTALFLIHAGCMKTCLLSSDGREQVTSFRMRDEMVGVESIGLDTYACDAIALDDCEVWELPYPPVLLACMQLPDLQARLTCALAHEIRYDRFWMLSLTTLTAEQRVAAFLTDLSARHRSLGFSGEHFVLRMSRTDMASFLAIKHETVSRALTHLSTRGLIDVRRRDLRILDLDGLLRAGSGHIN